MITTATFKRKTVSLDADIAAKLETQATADGRSVSNLVNHWLRQLMERKPPHAALLRRKSPARPKSATRAA